MYDFQLTKLSPRLTYTYVPITSYASTSHFSHLCFFFKLTFVFLYLFSSSACRNRPLPYNALTNVSSRLHPQTPATFKMSLGLWSPHENPFFNGFKFCELYGPLPLQLANLRAMSVILYNMSMPGVLLHQKLTRLLNFFELGLHFSKYLFESL